MSHFIWLHPSAFPLTFLFKVTFHHSLHTVHWINFFFLKIRSKYISIILADKDMSFFMYLGSHL